MLPPNYLINRADDIELMYSDLHTAILADIARRVADTIRATGKTDLMPSAIYQIERLNQAGLLREDIIKRIAGINDMSFAEINDLFFEAAVKTQKYDEKIYKAAGLEPVPVMQSPQMLNILQAGINKTLGSIERLTGTIAINSQAQFERILNEAYNKVSSGAFSANEAIAAGMDDLANEGVKVFSYASGKNISVEAAVRMNVLTGVNQTAAKITEETLKELNISLVRTSAHLGARNKGEGFVNHENWQGKIFYRKEIDKNNPENIEKGLQNNPDRGIIEAGGDKIMDIANYSQDYSDWKTTSIEKTMRTLAKNIAEHKEKIKNPQNVYKNWELFSENKKNGIVNHWQKEIRNFQTEIKAAENELKKRGEFFD